MNHNEVARRTAHNLPARSLTPRRLACDITPEPPRPGVRPLVRELPLRALARSEEDGT